MLAKKSFNSIMSVQVEQYGKVLLEPLTIKASDAEMFTYRISNVLGSLSPYQIKLARLIENKKIILKSSKMKKYFDSHKNERTLLLDKLNKLCKKFHKGIVKLSKDLPSYLMPEFLADKERKRGKLNLFKKRMKKRQQLEKERKKREKNTEPSVKVEKKKEEQEQVVVKKSEKLNKKKFKKDLYEEEELDLDGFDLEEGEELHDEDGQDYEYQEDEVDQEVEQSEQIEEEVDDDQEEQYEQEQQVQESKQIEEEEEDSEELEDPSDNDEIGVKDPKKTNQKDINWRNFEHPLLKDPKSLRSLSSRKIWKKKHGIKKKTNKRLLRKGFWKI